MPENEQGSATGAGEFALVQTLELAGDGLSIQQFVQPNVEAGLHQGLGVGHEETVHEACTPRLGCVEA